MGHKSTVKKRGSVTYGTDRENEVSKIFVISLRLIWRVGKKSSGRQQAVLPGGGGGGGGESHIKRGGRRTIRPAKLTNHSVRTK